MSDGQCTEFDVATFVVDYEMGELETGEFLRGFAHLLRTGDVWRMHSHYTRTAVRLIDGGYVTREGDLIEDAVARYVRDHQGLSR